MEPLVCSEGHSNPAGSAFCGSCGTPLMSTSVCVRDSVHSGKVLEPGPREQGSIRSNQIPTRLSNTGTTRVLFGVGASLVLAGLGFFGYQSFSNEPVVFDLSVPHQGANYFPTVVAADLDPSLPDSGASASELDLSETKSESPDSIGSSSTRTATSTIISSPSETISDAPTNVETVAAPVVPEGTSVNDQSSNGGCNLGSMFTTVNAVTRSGPSTQHTKLQTIPKDTEVTVSIIDDGWCAVYEGGWIRADLLDRGGQPPAPDISLAETSIEAAEAYCRDVYSQNSIVPYSDFINNCVFVLDWRYNCSAVDGRPGCVNCPDESDKACREEW